MRLLSLCAAVVLLAGCSTTDDPSTDDSSSPTPTPTSASPSPTETSEPPAESWLDSDITALGNEPFWTADISGTTLVWTTPENLESGGETIEVTRTETADTVTFEGVIDGQPLLIVVVDAVCNDGMSDREYPWTVERTLGAEVVPGCAIQLSAV